MADMRHQKLAQVLVNYSLAIRPGDKLRIRSEPGGQPLVREVYREAIRAGAHPTVQMLLEELDEILLRDGSDEQVRYVSELDRVAMEHFDASLYIDSSANTKALSGVDPKRLASRQQANAPLFERFMQRSAAGELRWCITLLPNHAFAQDAGMSLRDYEDFVYAACLLDRDDPIGAWREVDREQQRIVDFLTQHDEIHIVAPGTDVTYRVGGRTWINANGDKNFPDGEVFTGPIENSANGTVRFTYPAVYAGSEVEDVRLVFQDGKAVEATASRGENLLISMLDQDLGARYLGEVAFGLNYNVKRFSRNLLFDEKIGGTMHMALGKSYPETGGKNDSALHWDMVCDLREGKVYADGQLCYEGGRFTI